MAIPTTEVTFSSIQGEMGGSSPISLSEYYKGGAYVPANQSTSPVDGNPVSTGGTIRVGMFRGLTKTVSGGPTPFTAEFSTESFGSASANANIWFYIDGTMGTITGVTVIYDSVTGKNWYSPTTPSIGESHWIYATVTAGNTTPSGTPLNQWVQMNTGIVFGLTTGNGTAYLQRRYTLSWTVSTSAGGPALATGSIQVIATRDGIQ